MATNQRSYVCPKCDNVTYERGEFRAPGGWLAKLFDIQNKKFQTVSCTMCGYTEIYRGDSSTLGNVFDFLVGG